MQAKALAKSHEAYDGAVTFWMIPWHTVQLDVVIESLERLVPRADWTVHHNMFVQAYGVCVDMDFNVDKAPPVERGNVEALQAFWTSRNGNFAETWDLFQQVIPARVALVWAEAYEATRVHDLTLANVPDETPAEKKSATRESGKKSKNG